MHSMSPSSHRLSARFSADWLLTETRESATLMRADRVTEVILCKHVSAVAADWRCGGWERTGSNYSISKPWIVPIPGTTKLERLTKNVGAAALELTASDLRELDGAIARIAIQGDRYPPPMAANVGR